MKNYRLVITSLLILFTLSIKAQLKDRIINGANVKNPSLEKFVGTWTAKTDSLEVTFYFHKENFDFKSYKMDCIVGFHKFTNQNHVVSDNTNWKKGSIKEGHNSFSGTNSKNHDILTGHFAENPTSLRWKLSFSISPDNKKLIMTAIESPQYGVNVEKAQASIFPKKLTFIKM
ncbi:hypothetical protein SAMN06265348_107340 [Pedobacter westerhofensis]|uniref:DUF6705 domain-containing protein n=1 Tax=Pedobacter westerhofensis TaxID=425512 RepID=A0A521EB18_9SPHI|nr:DUF6705 family protein [Pedobacter westerhofensis]SMO81117.1 hypothetical protein SAMN06265348_107340 [Pedobacter westerhofensis]